MKRKLDYIIASFVAGMLFTYVLHTVNRHTVATKYMEAATHHSERFRAAKTGILREYHFQHEMINIDCANAVMETW